MRAVCISCRCPRWALAHGLWQLQHVVPVQSWTEGRQIPLYPLDQGSAAARDSLRCVINNEIISFQKPNCWLTHVRSRQNQSPRVSFGRQGQAMSCPDPLLTLWGRHRVSHLVSFPLAVRREKGCHLTFLIIKSWQMACERWLQKAPGRELLSLPAAELLSLTQLSFWVQGAKCFLLWALFRCNFSAFLDALLKLEHLYSQEKTPTSEQSNCQAATVFLVCAQRDKGQASCP